MRIKLRTAYLGLGSNLGDRATNLNRALHHLERLDLQIVQVSSIYQSQPVGPVTEQPNFLNAVVQIESSLTPLQLLRHCLAIETKLGRERLIPKGPRLIDIDLLLVEDLLLETPELILPHPELTHRAFVLVPLLELTPMLINPRDGTLLCCKVGALLRSQSIICIGYLSGFPAAERPFYWAQNHTKRFDTPYPGCNCFDPRLK
jgi:2-amino-4-hydroxy-6-hydroxymethyldihydropteridine diphosphokinase